MFAQRLPRVISACRAAIALVVMLCCSTALAAPESMGSYDLRSAIAAGEWHTARRILDRDATLLSVAEQMLLAHAKLASNRNNESFCLFLSVFSGDSVRVSTARQEWFRWTYEFVQNNADKSVAHYLHGDALARLGRWDEAIKSFDKAIQLNPNNALAWNARGVVSAAIGSWANARIDFENAIKADSLFADAYANLAFRNIDLEDGAEGTLKHFNKALDLSPDFTLALIGRGCIDLVLGEYEKAQEDFEKSSNYNSCTSAIFLDNAIRINAYWYGMSKEQFVAMNSADTVGTTFDVGFQGAASAFDHFVSQPSQSSYNSFITNFSRLPDHGQLRFTEQVMAPTFSSMPELRSAAFGFNDRVREWNAGPAQLFPPLMEGIISGVGAGAGAAVGTFAGHPFAGAGIGTGVGTAVGALATDPIRNTTNLNLGASNLLDQHIFSPLQVGGVNTSLAQAHWESGRWPFVAHYGLAYNMVRPGITALR